MEIDVSRAIENDQFTLEFQPFVDLSSGLVAGGEALSRMNGGEEGVAMPEEFLATVVGLGAHSRVDFYVFVKICVWLRRFAERGKGGFVSCNFSRITMSKPDFAAKVTAMAAEHGVPPEMIAIEITETDSETSREDFEMGVRRLRDSGFTIMLDDFGAGVTSVADIQRLPVQIIKLDKSLLDMAEDRQGVADFGHIVRLAREMGMKVLCEGVETSRQAATAKDAGCGYAQGFFFHKPVSAAEFERLLPERRRGLKK